jgi:hypothetical protein
MPNSEIFNVTTPTDREIVVTRIFNAPRNLVFEAWTNPQYLPLWMLGPDGWTMPVLRNRPPPRRLMAPRLAPLQRQRDGDARRVPRSQTARARSLQRVLGPRLARNPQHRCLLRARRQDTATIYASKEARHAALKTGMKQGMALSYDRL